MTTSGASPSGADVTSAPLVADLVGEQPGEQQVAGHRDPGCPGGAQPADRLLDGGSGGRGERREHIAPAGAPPAVSQLPGRRPRPRHRWIRRLPAPGRCPDRPARTPTSASRRSRAVSSSGSGPRTPAWRPGEPLEGGRDVHPAVVGRTEQQRYDDEGSALACGRRRPAEAPRGRGTPPARPGRAVPGVPRPAATGSPMPRRGPGCRAPPRPAVARSSQDRVQVHDGRR